MHPRIAGAGAALLAVLGSTLAEPISNDRLCRAIGDTPRVAIPARDRAFFEDRCVCLGDECADRASAAGRHLLDAMRCTVKVRSRLEERDPDGDFLPQIERWCKDTRSADQAYKLVSAEMKKAQEKDLEKDVERCIYTASLGASPKTAIDYAARCRKNPGQWEVVKDDVRQEAAAIERRERVQALSPELFDAAFRAADADERPEGFLPTCTTYLADHGQSSTAEWFLDFCDCARAARLEWSEQTRERCRLR